MAENILFICGSLNQTTMLHKIAQHLSEYNCYFTPYYADGIEHLAAQAGLLDFTVLGDAICMKQKNTLQEMACLWMIEGKNTIMTWLSRRAT